LIALEGAVGSFGAPVVGYLAEHVFGYLKNDFPIAQIPEDIRQANLNALANSATTVMVIPWIICFALYGVLHVTYPADRFQFSRMRMGHPGRIALGTSKANVQYAQHVVPPNKTPFHAD